MSRKFLCDEMCKGLGRWLRIAGYDTAIVETSLQDDLILQWAIREDRLLLTRDSHFAILDPESKHTLLLDSDDVPTCAKQLKTRGVNWLFSPFSRCLKCNADLQAVSTSDPLRQKLPEGVGECWQCPTCKQLFWRGSHTERMMVQLIEWEGPSCT